MSKKTTDNLKSFLRSVPGVIWWIVIVCSVLTCLLPILFTQLPALFDFRETGQIGDTIGGTMGPFIALIASFLTFIAFWAQYDANREMVKENVRNHFESRFYKMLDMHLESVNYLRSLSGKSTESVFREWYNEVAGAYKLLMRELGLKGFLDGIISKRKNDSGEIEFVRKLRDSEDERRKVMFDIAYSVLFMGNSISEEMGEDAPVSRIQKLATYFPAFHKLKHEVALHSLPAMNEILGRYYRHLFQIVKFVDDQDDGLYEEKDWKEDYIGLLRSQMSDFEQLLLYCNAQSSMGAAWNEKHYIEKYRLIKNIPYDSIFHCAGIPPVERYSEAIKDAEARGEAFFDKM